MNSKQKYELIRPILRHEKTPKQISEETGVPHSNIYRYLKRFQEGGEAARLSTAPAPLAASTDAGISALR